MTSRRGLWAASLLIAVSARAQVELRVAPVVSAPVALAPAAPPSLSIAAPAAFAPSLAAVPALAPAALSAPAAEPTAAIQGALSDFSKLDLGSVDAATAHGAGESLMLKALGGEAAESGASVPGAPGAAPTGLSPPGRRLYLLSKPLRETVQLGPAARAAHVGYAIAWELFKAWVGWHATGHVMGAVAVLAVELPFSPAMVTGRSLLDLGVRYWRRKLAVLRELARAPGVERVRVLTAGQVEFSGPLARRKENTGLIFVDASVPPEPGRFGAAIPIADAQRQQVRLTFSRPDSTSAAVWTPTLADLLERRQLPPEIAEAWRKSLHAVARGQAPAQRLLEAAKGRDLRVEAVLVGGPPGDVPLGAIVEGPAVKTFIGLGRLDRVRAFLGRPLKPRSLPLSDTDVMRAGDARESGAWARLRRAWRRLAGSLILTD